MNWIYLVAGLVGGFLFKIWFDNWKSPSVRIIGVSKNSFSIHREPPVNAKDFDNAFIAYRIKVENRQKIYSNSAADNCMAWIELDSAPEAYQLCWVGGDSAVTINVGDVREVDFCARGDITGRIYAPTERGYFEPEPRCIGDGKSEIRGKLRITSRNSKREEKPFVIRPIKKHLEIIILDGEQEDTRTTKQTLLRRFLARLQRISESQWISRYLLRGLFITGVVVVAGLIIYIYLKIPISEDFTKATRGSVIFINVAALFGLIATYWQVRNRGLALLVTTAIDFFLAGMIFQLVSYLEKIH